MRQANQKVYVDKNGKLVPEGDPDACVLVAPKGRVLQDSVVARYSNVDEFFDDLKPSLQVKTKVEPKSKTKVKPPGFPTET